MLSEGLGSIFFFDSGEKWATLHFLYSLAHALSINELLRGERRGWLAIDLLLNDANRGNWLVPLVGWGLPNGRYLLDNLQQVWFLAVFSLVGNGFERPAVSSSNLVLSLLVFRLIFNFDDFSAISFICRFHARLIG